MRSFANSIPEAPPAQILAECYAAFERSADLDVAFSLEPGRLVVEEPALDGPRRLRPSEVFDLLD